jgi:cell division protein FtsZ
MAEIIPTLQTCATIKVVGVGGGGGNAINRMVADKVRDIEFIAVNTDAQALHDNAAPIKIAIGKTVTRGLGAGMNPEMGKRAAEESTAEIRNALSGADMVFLTAGLGGGTGSGAIADIAKIAKDVGALTVAVVTKPFVFEGPARKRIADDAHQELSNYVDAIITIPNDRVLQIIDKNTTARDAFKIIDDVLRQGVQGIAGMITQAGEVNVDFSDVKTIMQNSGSALMGIGRASGENRATEAAKQAVASPLLEVSIDGAKGILFTISGTPETLTMNEISEASKVITSAADDDAKIIFGLHHDPTLGNDLIVTVIATGFDNRERRRISGVGSEMPVSPVGGWRQTTTSVQSPQPSVAPVSKTPFHRPDGNADDILEDSSRMSAGDAGQTVSPSPFTKRSIPMQDSSVQTPPTRALPKTGSLPQQPPKPDPDDEWSIPTFLRKKMM